MTPEERRIYNEKYYAEHKKDITENYSLKLSAPIAVSSSVRQT